MNFKVITIFPELVVEACEHGVFGQAKASGLIQLEVINPRQFAKGNYKHVDDRPFGGSDGMVMLAEVMHQSILAANTRPRGLVYLSPKGKRFDDQMARAMARETQWTFLCARYGGIDERVLSLHKPIEISLGDFVLSGGELAACAMMDAISRFMPGVLGNAQSPHEESFADGCLEEPLYTRPQTWQEMAVPDILLSGDHALIKQWRNDVRLVLTWQRRPDLLSDKQRALLKPALERLTDLEKLGLPEKAQLLSELENLK